MVATVPAVTILLICIFVVVFSFIAGGYFAGRNS